jgi:hypothetical protein
MSKNALAMAGFAGLEPCFLNKISAVQPAGSLPGLDNKTLPWFETDFDGGFEKHEK